MYRDINKSQTVACKKNKNGRTSWGILNHSIVSDCMRKLFIISWLLLLSLCGTGCVRIAETITVGGLPPPYCIYSGTMGLVGFPVNAAVLGEGFHEKVLLPIVQLPLVAVDLPLELVVDTVCLPVDLIHCAQYYNDPPLDKYLRDNDLEGLEKKLKEGVSPNVISRWFHKREPLLYQAYENHNEEAFELLLKYGAMVPMELLQVEDNLDEYTYRMLQRVFRDGCPKELQIQALKDCFSYWILKYLMRQEQASPNDRLLVDFMVLLLENGFSPNEWNHRRGDLQNPSPNQYPLDVVMANTAMDPTEKDRLISAMRKHGALTYREANLLSPSESIPPMLQTD